MSTAKTRRDAYLGSILIVGIAIMASLFGLVIAASIIRTGYGWPALAATSVAVIIVSVAEAIYAITARRGF